MEPAREKVTFNYVEGASVVLITPTKEVVIGKLHSLGDELFAELEWMGMTASVPLLKDGFTSIDYRWEHFINLPFHIRANALGRIVICQS